MRRSTVARLQYRPYYNLPSKSEHGRRMTGFLTPYRHWMWKQNELWRNVHEAQFEHLRKVYKRQWLESFRVNADEYIYKYNITKSAQLAQWEHEMQGQEKKRVETQQMAQGRQALKKKHLDLLREFHERQFFYWYERASERLQYMEHIQYIPQADFQEHLERELDKYVVGSRSPYPLNFAGQMPMLEDAEGTIAQVPANLIANHQAEHQDSAATAYTAPTSSTLAEDELLQMLASAQEEDLQLREEDSAALRETLEEVAKREDARDADTRVARSMEETDAEREVNRRAYIDRGKTGSRSIFRRPRLDEEGGGGAAPVDEGPAPTRTRRSRLDKVHALQEQQDAALARFTARSLRGTVDVTTKPGEVAESTGRLLDRAAIPTLEALKQRPELASSSTTGADIRTADRMDKHYGRGKYRKKDGDGDDGEDL